MTSEYYSDESYCYNSNSFYVMISGTVFSSSLITAIISTIITVIATRLCCEGKCSRKNSITTSHSSTYHEQSLQSVAGPLYEEVELTNKDLPLNYSQNVAYQSTSKKEISFTTLEINSDLIHRKE